MNTGLDATKKAKKTRLKSGNGDGAMRKKVTFPMDRLRKSGGDNPQTVYI